jgi:hypothetical protein
MNKMDESDFKLNMTVAMWIGALVNLIILITTLSGGIGLFTGILGILLATFFFGVLVLGFAKIGGISFGEKRTK